LVYSFESFSLDPDRRELRRGLDLVAVQPQVFDVLSYLVRNRDRIVRKNDLIAGVWDGRIVSESTLSSRITAVRQQSGTVANGSASFEPFRARAIVLLV
jgi:DNA-binding winged helix-turn-helix (wHTH) protein